MAATSEWVVASAATEHTGEPQLAGYVCTPNTSNATEHADAPPIPMHWPTSSKHTGASSGEKQIVATEHADDTSFNQGSARSEDEQVVATEHVHVEEHDMLLTTDMNKEGAQHKDLTSLV